MPVVVSLNQKISIYCIDKYIDEENETIRHEPYCDLLSNLRK